MRDTAVKEIKQILQRPKGNNIVLLLGDSGSARYTTLKFLCDRMGLILRKESEVEAMEQSLIFLDNFVREEKTQSNSKFLSRLNDNSYTGYDENNEKHFSQAKLIDLVFEYASNGQNAAYLIRFLPDLMGFDWFKTILNAYYADERNIINSVFFSLSEEMEGVSSFKKRLEEASQHYRFNLQVIRCGSNETNICKALLRIMHHNQNLLSKIRTKLHLKELATEIARDSSNNIHLSTQSFQSYVTNQLNVQKTQSSLKESRQLIKQQKNIWGDNIFHKLGKVLYNKRRFVEGLVPSQFVKDARKKGTFRYQGDAFDKTKAYYYVTPQEIVDSLQSERSAYRFRLGIQNNYPGFVGDIKDCAKIANGICRIEEHLRNFRIRSNEANFEQESLRQTVQYARVFMNNSRSGGVSNKGQSVLESMKFKTYLSKPQKLGSRSVDELLISPELKQYLSMPIKQNANLDRSLPSDFEDIDSSSEDSENMTLAERIRRQPPLYNLQKPSLTGKSSLIRAAARDYTASVAKSQWTDFGNNSNIGIEKSVLQMEIGDLIPVNEDSLDDIEFELLETNFYRSQANESQRRLDMDAEIMNLDLQFESLNELISHNRVT